MSTPEELSQSAGPVLKSCFDCFLSHNWGTDEIGRNNHDRASLVNEALKAKGLKIWFDTEQLHGDRYQRTEQLHDDINRQIDEGVNSSNTIACFVTKQYIEKAGGKGEDGENDICKFEFDTGLRRKGVNRLISVVMEKGCCKTKAWPGVVGGKLGIKRCIDLSKDGAAFDSGIEELCATASPIIDKQLCY